MPDTSQMAADEMRALLQSQQEAIGHLQARLEGLAVAERTAVPDSNVVAILGRRQSGKLDEAVG